MSAKPFPPRPAQPTKVVSTKTASPTMPPPPVRYPGSAMIQAKAAPRALAPPPVTYAAPNHPVQAKAAPRAIAPPPVRYTAPTRTIQAKHSTARQIFHVSPPWGAATIQPMLNQQQAALNYEKSTVQSLVTKYKNGTLAGYLHDQETHTLLEFKRSLNESIENRKGVQSHYTDTSSESYKTHAFRITVEEDILEAVVNELGVYIPATDWVADKANGVERRDRAYYSRDDHPGIEQRGIEGDDGFTTVVKKKYK